MKIELEKYNIQMPAFSKIGGILANELSVDEAACKNCLIYVPVIQMVLFIHSYIVHHSIQHNGYNPLKFGEYLPFLNVI